MAVRMSGGDKELPHMGYKHACRGATGITGETGATPEEVAAEIATIAKEREDAALALASAAGERKDRACSDSLLGKALELFTARDAPDVHVHLPEPQPIEVNLRPDVDEA
jgi:hypothetical protein